MTRANLPEIASRIAATDRRVAAWMRRHGHRWERLALGGLFAWFGTLKILGHESATSVIAKTVYAGAPETTTTLLGVWEVGIGLCLLVPSLVRVGVALIAIRLPGTLLALVLRADVCWTDVPGVPTIQGQYLIKDLALFAAALVIGGSVRSREPAGPPAAGSGGPGPRSGSSRPS